MILRTAYVRFYRAFNLDYLRKRHPDAKLDPWDQMDDGTFYPYVGLEVDPEFTVVVGANESGKSQLLQAIECAPGTTQPTPTGFCRYSTYFTVAEAMRIPHFGLHFEDVTPEEANAISRILNSDDAANISSSRIFRTSTDNVVLYVDHQANVVDDPQAFDDIMLQNETEFGKHSPRGCSRSRQGGHI